MRDDDLHEICRKLKPVIGDKADALWLAYVTSEDPDMKREAESFIQLFGIRYLNKRVDERSIYLPPPTRETAKGEFHLGDVYYGKTKLHPLYLTRENFIKHLGIFSITGGGKTNVAYHLVLGLLEKQIPFTIVDWKRSYRSLLSLDHPDVKRIKVFTIGRKGGALFNWNPLRGPPGVHPKTWISVLVETLEKSHLSGPGAADILIDIFDRKFEQMGFYDGSSKAYPNFFDAAEELNKLNYRGRQMLWQQSGARIVRTFVFGPSSGAFNARNPLHLEDLLDQPVIFELDQELPKPLRIFFSEILFRWLHLFRLHQGETDELRHVLFIEELHNLFPKSYSRENITNSLELGFREVRSFGQGLVGIDQHPSLLPISVLGNTNVQIILGLQHEDDIMTAKRSLFLDDRDLDIFDRLGVGEGVVKIRGRSEACYVKFPLVPIKKGVIDDAALASDNAPSDTTS